MDIKIIVAAHKEYWMPEDDVYLPLHVGKEGKRALAGIPTCDNTGDNISAKNDTYCELTGLYWAWKNLDCEYLGLCHYRRYFGHYQCGLYKLWRKRAIYGRKDYEKLLGKYDIILPRVGHWLFRPSASSKTLRSHYEKDHYKRDLDVSEEVIREKYPEYIPAFETAMASHVFYSANMFVMKKSLSDEYCAWLFDILLEVERRIDISGYDAYQRRVFGFLSERLFNVWLTYQKLHAAEAKIIRID